jgi:hypothetical protein
MAARVLLLVALMSAIVAAPAAAALVDMVSC